VKVLAALALAGVLLSGCSDDRGMGPLPGPAQVEVDTPDLRELKQEAGVEPCVPGRGEPVEGGLPEITLPCFGGGKDVDLSTLRGPMVVNLWASWCQPCRAEMPILQDFHEQYGDRVPVLGIGWQDTQPAAAMELVADTGVTYPLLADPNTSLGSVDGMPIRGLPGIVLLDADGEVAYRNLEEIESGQQLVDLVEEHLGVTL
jgi:thiol-disulfide isomerase/thioredoxin